MLQAKTSPNKDEDAHAECRRQGPTVQQQHSPVLMANRAAVLCVSALGQEGCPHRPLADHQAGMLVARPGDARAHSRRVPAAGAGAVASHVAAVAAAAAVGVEAVPAGVVAVAAGAAEAAAFAAPAVHRAEPPKPPLAAAKQPSRPDGQRGKHVL